MFMHEVCGLYLGDHLQIVSLNNYQNTRLTSVAKESIFNNFRFQTLLFGINSSGIVAFITDDV